MSQKVEIKKRLLDLGISQTDIARKTGASKPLVSQVIAGTRGKAKRGKAFEVLEMLKEMGCQVGNEDDAA